jgi:hypothetical protein
MALGLAAHARYAVNRPPRFQRGVLCQHHTYWRPGSAQGRANRDNIEQASSGRIDTVVALSSPSEHGPDQSLCPHARRGPFSRSTPPPLIESAHAGGVGTSSHIARGRREVSGEIELALKFTTDFVSFQTYRCRSHGLAPYPTEIPARMI